MTLGGGAPVPLPSVLLSGAPRFSVAEMLLRIHTSGCAMDSHPLMAAAILWCRGDSLKKLMLAGLVAVLGFAPAFALAQAQADEKMIVGHVQSVDETGTKVTLTDGTRLVTPPGSVVGPGVRGTMVVGMYREENGNKILTKLAMGQSEPAPSTPSESPKR